MICPACQGKGCPACQGHGEVFKVGPNTLPEDKPGWTVRVEVRINHLDDDLLGEVVAQMQGLEVLPRNGAVITDYTLHNAAMIALMEVMEALRGHHTATVRELNRRLEEQ